MKKKVLYIQPFVLDYSSDRKILGELTLIWFIYLENYLKSKIQNLSSDLLYLPIELKHNKIKINSLEDKDVLFEQIHKLISNLNFEVDNNTFICISGTTSYHYLSSKVIAEFFQEFYPNSIVIFGGAHASASPSDFSYANSPIDYTIIGEGEHTLYEIIKNSFKKQDFSKIMIGNPIQNLNQLPPIMFSLLDKYVDSIKDLSVSLSRGCPYQCSFCMEQKISNYCPNIRSWRVYSPKRAIKETKAMIEYGLSHGLEEFGFVDPTFGTNRKWFRKFLKLWNFEETIPAAWIETRFDLLNESLIECLKRKNFRLWYGLESGSMTMLSIMRKTINPISYLNKFKEIAEIHEKLDYITMLNVIFNHPGETQQTYQETFDYLKNIVSNDRNNNLNFSLRYYHHFPGTNVYNRFNEYTKKYGSRVYLSKWWKSEKFLTYGPYMVRSSRSLKLRESIERFTKIYEELGEINLRNLKKYKPENYLGKGVSIKKAINEFKLLKSKLLGFMDTNEIEPSKKKLENCMLVR